MTSWVRTEDKTALTAYSMYWATVKEFSKIMVTYPNYPNDYILRWLNRGRGFSELE